jgi:hypothetical protein
MALFKRKKLLLKRIESLENYLGLHYTVDSDDYAQHILSDGWGEFKNLKDDVKALKDKNGKK